MAIVTLPTFSKKQILLAEQLNALVAALNAKFSGGFDASDLQWPLEAEGDLAMGNYNITGARKIMGVINAANYPTLQDAVTAAGTGGCVFIPPDTTVTASGVAFTGDGVAIIGAGPSSEIMLTTDSTDGFILRSATTGQTGFMLANLTMNGNGHTGTGQAGLILRRVSDIFIHDVIFKDFSGPAIQFTNDGSDGNACQRLYLRGCTFSGGDSAGAYHLLANDLSDALISSCVFKDCADDTIHFAVGSGTQLMRRIAISQCSVSGGAGAAIHIVGGGAVASANQADISVYQNVVSTLSGSDPAIVLGTTGGRLLRVSAYGNSAPSAPGDGLSVCADYGHVSANILYSATGDGIDLTESSTLEIVGNDVRSAGAYGIEAHLSTSCIAHDNRTQGASTGPIYRAATLRQWANGDTVGSLPATAYVNPTSDSGTGGGDPVDVLITIPANSLRVGDVIKARGVFTSAGTADAGNGYLYYKATGGADQQIASTPLQGDNKIFHIEGVMIIVSSTTAIAMGTAVSDGEAVVERVTYSTALTVNLATSAEIYLHGAPHANVTANARFLYVERTTAEVV